MSMELVVATLKARHIAVVDISELPELEGSEKQISWANEIRVMKISEMDDLMESMIEATNDEDAWKGKYTAEQIILANKNIRNANNAAWWIQEKGTEITRMIKNDIAEQ